MNFSALSGDEKGLYLTQNFPCTEFCHAPPLNYSTTHVCCCPRSPTPAEGAVASKCSPQIFPWRKSSSKRGRKGTGKGVGLTRIKPFVSTSPFLHALCKLLSPAAGWFSKLHPVLWGLLWRLQGSRPPYFEPQKLHFSNESSQPYVAVTISKFHGSTSVNLAL